MASQPNCQPPALEGDALFGGLNDIEDLITQMQLRMVQLSSAKLSESVDYSIHDALISKFDTSLYRLSVNLIALRNLRARTSTELRMRRNRLASINKLPVEVFAQILAELKPLSPYAWYRVTEVCRRWRAIATSCPLLWTFIRVRYARGVRRKNQDSYARLCLERAKEAPLDVQLHVEDSSRMPRSGLLQELGQRCGQIRTFIAEFEPRLPAEVPAAVLRHFSSAAPNLEYLIIDGIRDSYNMKLRTMFGGHMPSLHFLDLSRCDLISFPTKGVDNLTVLALAHLHWNNFAHISYLLSILRTNSSLRTIQLEQISVNPRIDYKVSSLVNSQDPVIPMGALRILKFDGCDASLMHAIFSRIELPRHDDIVHVQLLSSLREVDTLLLPTTSAAGALRPTHPLPGIEQLAIFLRPNKGTQILAAGPTRHLYIEYLPTHPDYENLLTIPELDSLGRLMPFADLQELWLEGQSLSMLFYSECQGLFANASSVVTLVLDVAHSCPIRCLGALCAPRSGDVPLPCLRTLVFITGLRDPDEDPDFDLIQSTLDCLLESRKDRGYEVSTLLILAPRRFNIPDDVERAAREGKIEKYFAGRVGGMVREIIVRMVYGWPICQHDVPFAETV